MPFEGEYANKAAHFDIVKNPDVTKFLQECNYLMPPSDAEIKAVCSNFEIPPSVETADLPDHVIAVDGSLYESNFSEQLPSTKLGYIKVGCTLIELIQYFSLQVSNGRYVDPFRVAALEQNNDALTFTLPSANITWKGKRSVRDS